MVDKEILCFDDSCDVRALVQAECEDDQGQLLKASNYCGYRRDLQHVASKSFPFFTDSIEIV